MASWDSPKTPHTPHTPTPPFPLPFTRPTAWRPTGPTHLCGRTTGQFKQLQPNLRVLAAAPAYTFYRACSSNACRCSGYSPSPACNSPSERTASFRSTNAHSNTYYHNVELIPSNTPFLSLGRNFNIQILRKHGTPGGLDVEHNSTLPG